MKVTISASLCALVVGVPTATARLLGSNDNKPVVADALAKENTEALFRELFGLGSSLGLGNSLPIGLSFSYPQEIGFSMTPRPTLSPTQAPTGTPTRGPTPLPTLPPTESPTFGPTPLPTLPPTPSPTFGPTPSPTPLPTLPPTLSPTLSPTVAYDTLQSCETAFAYCPGRSTCFIGSVYSSGPWGWNIDLDGLDLSGGNTLTCPLYAGAGQCNIANSKLVGQLVISENSVRWELGGSNGGQDYHLYGGRCQANDRGIHLTNGGVCTASNMGSWARVPGQYTLGASGFQPLYSNFQFDNTNDEGSYRKGTYASQSYVLFPIGGTSRRYLTAHAAVCPCSSSQQGCTYGSAPTGGSVVGVTTDAVGSTESSGPSAGLTAAIILLVAAAMVAAGLIAYRRYNRGLSSRSVSSGSESDAENEMGSSTV